MRKIHKERFKKQGTEIEIKNNKYDIKDVSVTKIIGHD